MISSARPSTSAVITAYNSERFVADAVASVRAQSHLPDEIVIVDDGSTDSTGEIARGLGSDIRYVWQANGGEAMARNRGIALARGEAVAFLDADDAWPPDHLAVLLDRLAQPPPVDIVRGRGRSFSNESWQAATDPAPHRLEAPMISFGCALVRRELFHSIGPIDQSLSHGVDIDWFFRCREQGVPFAVLDTVTLLYRRHDANVTNNREAGRRGLMDTIKKAMDRRRAAGDAIKPPANRDAHAGNSREPTS
jgi:glycosyltransferase involved in cell wall biosynthesis